jgi:hypothetical protein
MTRLSPLDALGPAFRRTREVLAQPFRFWFFLKIALIGALTQPGFYSASISYPINGVNFATVSRLPHRHAFIEPSLAVFGLVAIVIGVVSGLALWVGITYLYCRLRFTLFDLVVHKRGRVGQAWSGYGRQAWRYFGLVILTSLAFLVVASIIIGPAILNVLRVVRPLVVASHTSPALDANPFPVFGAMFPLLLAIFAVGALWAVADALMQDFLLPPMAIEDAPLESAFRRFFALLKSDFGSLAIYVLLRFAVGIGLVWILFLLLLVLLGLCGLLIFGVGTVIYHLLWTSMLGQVVCVALAIIVGVIALAVYLVAMISVYGIAAVFQQSYSAYFFGGRYVELGNQLEPPPAVDSLEPPAASTPPTSIPPLIPPWSEPPAVW